jgi:mono/diheme cytochrome c family protein
MRTFVWAIGAGAAVAFVATAAAAAPKGGQGAAVKRGEYLVTIGGCNDCHTPWKMGANGPEQDRSRMLSGHPQELVMPAAPQVSPPWAGSMSGTFTAWAGPWGVSFAANLTPDPDTGLGRWTVESFVEAMRTGRHQGRGRPIMPPMPWQNVSLMTDADLKATFAYLRSIPAIKNRVPDPIPAEGGGQRAEGAGTPGPETGTGSGATAPPAPPAR